jgi:hypothetical protein
MNHWQLTAKMNNTQSMMMATSRDRGMEEMTASITRRNAGLKRINLH